MASPLTADAAPARAPPAEGPPPAGPRPILDQSRISGELKGAEPFATADDLQPRKAYPPIESVENAGLTGRDTLALVVATVEQQGLVGHNLDGYNELVERGLNRIMSHHFRIDRRVRNERSQTPEDRELKSFRIRLQFDNTRVGMPVSSNYLTGQFADLYPGQALLSGHPYAGAVTLGATVTVDAFGESDRAETKEAVLPPFQIGAIPVMVRSRRCHTRSFTREALKCLGEDPGDPGGYFIAKRNEYIVYLLENISYNKVHVHCRMKSNELARAEFLSQPGGAFENSTQVRARLMASGQLTVEINSTKLEKVLLPFWLVYRLLGMTDDRAVAETVVFDVADPSPLTRQMLDVLERAFPLAPPEFADLVGELDHERLVRVTGERIARASGQISGDAFRASESALQYLNEDLLGSPSRPGGLDQVFLPHVGGGGDRVRKLRFLGLIIRKLLLAHLGAMRFTDRDSYRNKRAHGAGVSLAKAFKTQVNASVIVPVIRALKRNLRNVPWRSLSEASLRDIVCGALSAGELNRGMETAITAGNRTVLTRRRAVQNRVGSQVLERKTGANIFSALRTVVTQNPGNASKQTERADMMRRVHPTYVGFICAAQSPDTGESVGMRKQLAITAGVCDAGDDAFLERRLLADPAVVPLDAVEGPELLRRGLARVLVNGRWVGCCESAPALAARYRALRREGRGVDPFTTIYWDLETDEIEFWLDVGRLRRPLLIVDNNLAAYDAALLARAAWRRGGRRGAEPPRVEFVQNVRLTPAHVAGLRSGALGLAALVAEGVAEYVTPEEQENCYLAESVEALRACRNDVTQRFTHCDVQQAIFGLAALLAPHGNFTQPVRITLQTNQGRQAGGWYALNFPHRADKNRFFQFYVEAPLVSTLTTRWVPPSSVNVNMLYAAWGDNEEDSVVIDQGAVDRGLFTGVFFRNESYDLEKGESFATPDPLTTKNLQPGACYEKLDEHGLIRRGATAVYGDVLVGVVAKLKPQARADEKFRFVDRSLVYRRHEPGFVEEVKTPRGANDELFAVVKLRYTRSLRPGDKLSSRSGNKNILAILKKPSDMPHTEAGLTPDLIVNPHSLPTRMTVGQMIETRHGKVCARRGAVLDGTAFLPVDHESVGAELYALGFRFNGRERMYNGETGAYFDAAMFVGQVAEQRLLKFVVDDLQVVGRNGPTDATTGQPLGGKHVQGGLRLGEMELWCLFAQGASLFAHEKLWLDSSGREAAVCRGCGSFAVYNAFRGIVNCIRCGELADIAVVETTKAALLFHEELAASNVRQRLGLAPREFSAGLAAPGAAAGAPPERGAGLADPGPAQDLA